MAHERIWFEIDDNQNPLLVRESGERIVSDEHSKMFEQTVQSQQGWQRSRLFMSVNDIWDATAFGATMSATFAYGPNDEGVCYTFTSCEEADRRMYKNLTEEQVAACRKNVDEFYADPELQKHWQDVILHPICLLLQENGTLKPMSLKKLNPIILKKFHRQTVRIGDKDSYKWVFGYDND